MAAISVADVLVIAVADSAENFHSYVYELQKWKPWNFTHPLGTHSLSQAPITHGTASWARHLGHGTASRAQRATNAAAPPSNQTTNHQPTYQTPQGPRGGSPRGPPWRIPLAGGYPQIHPGLRYPRIPPRTFLKSPDSPLIPPGYLRMPSTRQAKSDVPPLAMRKHGSYLCCRCSRYCRG